MNNKAVTNYELLLKYTSPPNDQKDTYINILEKDTGYKGYAIRISGEEEIYIYYQRIELLQGKKVSKIEFNNNYDIISAIVTNKLVNSIKR